MSEFKAYRHKHIAWLRPVTEDEIVYGPQAMQDRNISIGIGDLDSGSPKYGDMVARNQNNHADQWLVSAAYFIENFEPV